MQQKTVIPWIYLRDYALAMLITIVVTVFMLPLRSQLNTTTIALLYLIPVTVSTTLGRLGPGLVSGFLAFLLYNYYFLAPYHTLSVHQPQDITALGIFLLVAALISQLVGRARQSLAQAVARERESTRLYELSMALVAINSPQEIGQILASHLQQTFLAEFVTVQIISNSGEAPLVISHPEDSSAPPEQPHISMPIETTRLVLGTIYLWRTDPLTETEQRVLRTFATQTALALERATFSQSETRARILEESDRMKSALLSSVSHELRTPLATIKASATSLLDSDVDNAARQELLETINEETDHLNLLVGNLLDMSRIESGALYPALQWNQLSEIVESAVGRLHRLLQDHTLEVEIPENIPLIPVDFMQIERVFVNLINNSAKYAPPDTLIRVSARQQGSETVLVQVANQGPPVPEQHLQRIFDKFYRIKDTERVTGTGLGLSICKGIVEAHGGRIWAENLCEGFAFNFTLPLQWEGKHPTDVQLET